MKNRQSGATHTQNEEELKKVIGLNFRAVVHLTKRQDVNQVAEKLYRQNFTSTAKIKIREYSRDLVSITYMVSDADEIEPLFLIKPI